MFRAKTLQRHDERGPASGFRSEDCLVSLKIFQRVTNKVTQRCVPAAPGQDHGPGEAAPAGYLLCQRAGKRHPVQSQREEGFPVRAAGHFQRADRQEERSPPAGVHLQKQHQGEHQSARHAGRALCCHAVVAASVLRPLRSAVWEWRSTLRNIPAAWC